MEQAILSQYRRLPGFHSEFVGLEVMGMQNEQIGFEDVLNGMYHPSYAVRILETFCHDQVFLRCRFSPYMFAYFHSRHEGFMPWCTYFHSSEV
jgi:hypothetical protein